MYSYVTKQLMEVKEEDRRNHGSDVQELMVVMGLLGIEWQKTGVYGET